MTAPTPPPVVPPSATASPAGDLSRYVGAYPFDEVGGTAFLTDPQVRAGIEGAVSDPAVRARVLDRDVTATPIAQQDGRILSFGCEPHNCGPHNWTVAITPDGKNASVCYYDQDRRVARWYPEGAGASPGSSCPSGDE